MIRPKLIYLARRNPSLDPDGFVRRWRRHGALGMSMPRWKNIWRYVHNDVARGPTITGVSDAYDGVGIVWHRSPEARRAHREDRGSQGAMERDELETFAELVGRFCALYEETVLHPPRAGARIKLVRFLRFGPEEQPDAFIRQASEILDVIAMGAGNLGQVRNIRMPPEVAPWGLPFDMVEELWFDDLATAAHAQARRLAHNGLDALIAEEVTVITNEVVLYRDEPA